MFITKIIEVGLNIYDPNEVYVDLHNNVLGILKNRYEGICFRSCYIVKVLDIIEISDGIIAQEGNDSYCKVNVRMNVQALVYSRDETINGCLVTKKEPNKVIICETPYASIYMSAQGFLASIKVGQIIPVRVGLAKYTINSKKISINAYPYVLTTVNIAYSLTSAPDSTLLKDSLTRMTEEEEMRDKLMASNNKGWTTFNQLLYPWKTEQQVPTGVGTIAHLRDVIEKPPGITSADTRIDKATGNVIVYKGEPPSDIEVLDHLDVTNAYIALIEGYVDHLRTVREMLAIYNTKELMMEHANLWQILKSQKV